MPDGPAHRSIPLCVAFALLGACGQDREAPPASAAAPPVATFVGGQVCAACHVEQAQSWAASHHALAMQRATSSTVRGDFGNTGLEHGTVRTRFFRRGDEFWVNTDDAQGNLRDFRIDFTFGVEPLQQYLVALEGGRYQALLTAWDTRSADAGGQRWFHLSPDEAVDHEDPLHWTGVYYNWNSSCAECHSTGLTKNLDTTNNSFATVWSSDSVDCEACHGPGSLHAAAPTTVRLGLPAVPRSWVFAGGAGIAQRVPSGASTDEIEVCAQCHSRRTQLNDSHEPGDSFLDGFRPALLDPLLYHADGQILDEVYEYGSFLQSRMYAVGVTCTDCHDPHSGLLRATGNGLCGTCHAPSAFDTPEHHRHSAGDAGSQCVDCHMPERTYMVVDGRRDHSFRVPRPDLSTSLGVPNACTNCHEDRSVEWAASQVAAWFPGGRSGTFHYAQALHAGRTWAADRHSLLTRVIGDPEMPAMVRATAINLLAAQMDDSDIELIGRGVSDGAPLVQLAALEALQSVPVSRRIDFGQRFLSDAPIALRIAAARALLPAREGLSVARRGDLDRALAEYRATQQFNADRVESLLNLGNLAAESGAQGDAEAIYRRALETQPRFAPTYVNLADLYRQQGREREAEELLRRGIELEPGDPSLKHALGLSLVRSNRLDEALELLREASELGTAEPLYAYVYGVALHSSGARDAGLEELENVAESFPGYAPVLFALATMHRDAGGIETAREYARRLLDVSPGDSAARALAAELGAGPTR